jgi:enterochelin esterase-like enzyme
MRRNLYALAIAAAAFVVLLSTASSVGAAAQGSITAASFRSATLGEDLGYNVYLPTGYESSTTRYPTLYLLHGRGDSMSAWTQVKGQLDAMIANGEIPPLIAIMPDAPWSSRASYYVDSSYDGADRGRKVETAFVRDLVPHIDATYRTLASRAGRAIAGYSMAATAHCATRSSIRSSSAPRSCSAPPSTSRPRRATRARASSAPSARARACSSTRSTGS